MREQVKFWCVILQNLIFLLFNVLWLKFIFFIFSLIGKCSLQAYKMLTMKCQYEHRNIYCAKQIKTWKIFKYVHLDLTGDKLVSGCTCVPMHVSGYGLVNKQATIENWFLQIKMHHWLAVWCRLEVWRKVYWRVTQTATKSNSSWLSALQTSQEYHNYFFMPKA